MKYSDIPLSILLVYLLIYVMLHITPLVTFVDRLIQ